MSTLPENNNNPQKTTPQYEFETADLTVKLLRPVKTVFERILGDVYQDEIEEKNRQDLLRQELAKKEAAEKEAAEREAAEKKRLEQDPKAAAAAAAAANKKKPAESKPPSSAPSSQDSAAASSSSSYSSSLLQKLQSESPQDALRSRHDYLTDSDMDLIRDSNDQFSSFATSASEFKNELKQHSASNKEHFSNQAVLLGAILDQTSGNQQTNNNNNPQNQKQLLLQKETKTTSSAAIPRAFDSLLMNGMMLLDPVSIYQGHKQVYLQSFNMPDSYFELQEKKESMARSYLRETKVHESFLTATQKARSKAKQTIELERSKNNSIAALSTKENKKKRASSASSIPQKSFALPPPRYQEQVEEEEYEESNVDQENQPRQAQQPRKNSNLANKTLIEMKAMAIEKEKNKEFITKKMKEKTTFSKNPRFSSASPSSPTKTTTTTEQQQQQQQPEFVPSFETVKFTDYGPGQVYEIPLKLTNVTTLSKRMRIIPPQTRYFSISLSKSAATTANGGNSGLIAPGMSVEYSVRFAPDSLIDYEDSIFVQTESSKRQVKLQAWLPKPDIDLPPVFACGPCLVGMHNFISIVCKNRGAGHGRFLFCSEQDLNRNLFLSKDPSSNYIQINEFVIEPAEFELASGQSITLRVYFSSSTSGDFNRPVFLKCNEETFNEFSLTGTGVFPHVIVSKIGDQPFPESQKALIAFDDLNPNAIATKKITVESKTSIPVDFHWEITHQGSTTNTTTERKNEEYFAITPAMGRFKANEQIEFSLQFRPTQVEDYFANVRLMVDNVLRPESEDHPLFSKFFNQLDPNSIALNSTGAATAPDPLNFFNTRQDAISNKGKFGSDDEVSVPIVDLQVHGSGKDFDVSLDPPVVLFGSAIVINKPTKRTFTIFNNSDSAAPFRWEIESNDTISYEENPLCPIPANSVQPRLRVRLDPKKGTIEAGGSKQITLTIVPLTAEDIEETIMCSIASSFCIPLHISAKVEGPRIRIEDPAIDFGLVEVGAEVSAPVTIKNFSSSTLHWRFVSLSDSALSNNASDSSRSSASEAGGEQDRSSSSSSAIGPQFVFLPASGTLEKGQEKMVSVFFRPHFPQQLREIIECQVLNGLPQYISVRAEVQSPKVCILGQQGNPSSGVVDLGTTYVDVPCVYNAVMKNLSFVQTYFQWTPTLDASNDFIITCNPESGSLDPGQELQVAVSIVPNRPGGDFEFVVPCIIQGMATPIGIAFKTRVNGLTVALDVEDPEASEKTRTKMEAEETLRFCSNLTENLIRDAFGEPREVFAPIIDFGQVPIFSKKLLRLVLMNHSECLSYFALAFESFPAPSSHSRRKKSATVSFAPASTLTEASQRDSLIPNLPASRDSSGSSSGAALRPALSHGKLAANGKASLFSMSRSNNATASSSVANDASQGEGNPSSARFHSRQGRTFWNMKQEATREEEFGNELLDFGKGVAFDANVLNGRLVEWGIVKIDLLCCSNACGVYEDRLRLDMDGMPTIFLPVRAKVVGVPLRILPNTLGLFFAGINGDEPTISWGPCPRNSSNPSTKIAKIQNRTPQDLRVRWKFFEDDVPIKVRCSTNDGKIHVEMSENKPTQNSPFSVVSPSGGSSEVIPAFGTTTFHISFLSKEISRFHGIARLYSSLALLPGDHVDEDAEENEELMKPLRIDLYASTIDAELSMDCKKQLRLNCSAMVTEKGQAAEWKDQYTRKVTLTNNTPATLSFAVQIDAPFEIISTSSNAKSEHPLATAGKKKQQQQQPSQQNQDAVSTMFMLGSRDSIDVAIALRFRQEQGADLSTTMNLNREFAQNPALETPSSLAGAETTQSFAGKLQVKYSNGTCQDFPVFANVVFPCIKIETANKTMTFSTMIDFGTCSARSATNLLVLVNGTIASAKWKIVHNNTLASARPISSARIRPASAEHSHSSSSTTTVIDDPLAFEFDESEGIISGSTSNSNSRAPGADVSANYRKTIRICFNPKTNGVYESRFFINVEKGKPCEILCKGVGKFSELHDDKNILKK